MATLTPAQFFAGKTNTPSDMTSAEWERVELETRERAFFMACVTQAEVLDVFRQATAKVLTGEIGETDARRMIREGLARLGYVPRPGEEGSIKDLGTLRRQDVVIRTNIAMARNHAGYHKQWKARRAYPAKRMVRMQPRRVPRDWAARWKEAAAGLTDANADTMTALLDSPVWARLNRFGAPYPPYDYGSGMGDLPVSRADAEAALGAGVVRAWLSGRPVSAAPATPEGDVPAPTAPAPEPGATPAAPPAAPAPQADTPPEPKPAVAPPSTPSAPLPAVPEEDVPGSFPPVPAPDPSRIPARDPQKPEATPVQPVAPEPSAPGPDSPQSAPRPAPAPADPEASPSAPAPAPAGPEPAPAPQPPEAAPTPAPAAPPEKPPSTPPTPEPPAPQPTAPTAPAQPPAPPLPDQPAPGLNSTLEVTPAVTTPEGRQALADLLDGLAVWDGDKLVYTDPNGTRPYPADVIPGIISPPNNGGIPLRQRDALEAWAEGGAPALPRGSNLRSFFAALVWRILPMVEDAILTLTHWFGSRQSRVEALTKLPEGGVWTPVTEFPFLAVVKSAEKPRPPAAAADAWPLTLHITRYRTARDLTPAVRALDLADAHGHHVLFPRGTSFRVESVEHLEGGSVTINLSELLNHD